MKRRPLKEICMSPHRVSVKSMTILPRGVVWHRGDWGSATLARVGVIAAAAIGDYN